MSYWGKHDWLMAPSTVLWPITALTLRLCFPWLLPANDRPYRDTRWDTGLLYFGSWIPPSWLCQNFLKTMLHCSLRLFLPSFFPSLLHKHQASCSDNSPCILQLFSPFFLAGTFPNKLLAHLILYISRRNQTDIYSGHYSYQFRLRKEACLYKLQYCSKSLFQSICCPFLMEDYASLFISAKLGHVISSANEIWVEVMFLPRGNFETDIFWFVCSPFSVPQRSQCIQTETAMRVWSAVDIQHV